MFKCLQIFIPRVVQFCAWALHVLNSFVILYFTLTFSIVVISLVFFFSPFVLTMHTVPLHWPNDWINDSVTVLAAVLPSACSGLFYTTECSRKKWGLCSCSPCWVYKQEIFSNVTWAMWQNKRFLFPVMWNSAATSGAQVCALCRCMLLILHCNTIKSRDIPWSHKESFYV